MFFEMLFGYLISALIGAMAVICLLGYFVATGDLVIESSEKRKAKKEQKAAKRAERQELMKELVQKQTEKEEKEVESPKKKK